MFTQRWLHRPPMPFGPKDHDAGYRWETSIRQVQISRTIVFDAPRHARGFFEALIADNPGIGRPHNVEIIFARKIRRDTQGVFRTAIDRRDNRGVPVNVFYKHSRIKKYLKDGRAMRPYRGIRGWLRCDRFHRREPVHPDSLPGGTDFLIGCIHVRRAGCP